MKTYIALPFEVYCYALLNQEEYDKAEELLNQALAVTSDSSKKNELYAEWIDGFLYYDGQEERTLALANRFIAETDSSEESLLTMTDVYESQDRYEDAIEIYNRLIDLDSEKKGEYYSYRSFCYASLEQYDLALADHDRYGDLLDEKDDYFYQRRSNLLLQAEMFTEAIKDIDNAISLRRNRQKENADLADLYIDSFYVDRAGIHEKLNNLDEAEKDFNKAVELSSKDRNYAKSSRAQFYMRHGKDQLALDDLNDLIELTNHEDQFEFGKNWKLRAEVYEKLGEPDKAEADRKKAAELDAAFKERWGYLPYDDDDNNNDDKENEEEENKE